jgi:small GTP-binding protein
MSKRNQPAYLFKICLLGQGAVGKTCLARRLCYNTFSNSTKLTIGIDFYSYDFPILINGAEDYVKLQIWDFGGQNVFRKFFTYYIDGANGIFMCFSLINNQTMVALDWWYDKLAKFGPKDVPRIVVGTKHDLIRKKRKEEKVQELVIKQFMKRHNEDTFIRTSAKESFNVEKMFRDMTKKILDKHDFEYDKFL